MESERERQLREVLSYWLYQVDGGDDRPEDIVQMMCELYWPKRHFELTASAKSRPDYYYVLKDFQDAATGENAHDLFKHPRAGAKSYEPAPA